MISISRTAFALRQFAALASIALLAACSGGAPTAEQPVTQAPTVADYTGPAPATADVQAFKINVWENLKSGNRCGACHNATGQSPRFARNDDVNLAYQDALALVTLTDPASSRLVGKVGGGHNCWLSATSACADTMTVWVRNWAGATASGGKQIALKAPTDKDVGASKTFPTDAALFSSTVYPLLRTYCARCHASNADAPQQPYFADANVDAAYAAVRAKINLDTPNLSRLVVRLGQEFHNCWNNDCSGSANTMLAAVQNFANGIAPTQIDPALVFSKALTLYDGTVASGGNRFENNVVALWEFKTGMGTVAFDTSGVEPALNLNLSGDVTWMGGWGIKIGMGGKAQGATSSSKKLADQIKATGEYSIEAWVAPGNVNQENAWIVSYSGGTAARNFTLAQREYQYQAFNRSSKTDSNGAPAMLTNAADRDAQASLQHVVLTYDPVGGRKLYVNGVFTGDVDAAGGGSLADWDDSFAFVLGNETSGARPWTGVLRLVAVHNRALSAAQIQQNFVAGVGERYFLLFNVSDLVNVPQSYVMFEAAQYDSYSYLFTKPTYINLDPAVKPDNIQLKGIRIGLNGSEAKVGQAYVPLDKTISASNYTAAAGQQLSGIGTVVPLEKGPDSDLFFLTFEQIGTHTNVRTEGAVPAPATPPDAAPVPDVGARNFSEINASMASVTGVATTDANVRTTYMTVQQQLPSLYDLNALLASHQVGVAQLAIQYCDSLVESGQAASFFPGLNLGAAAGSYFASDANKALVKEAVETRFGVTVTDVNVMRVRGKTRRFGRRVTRTPWWKKAIVTVAPGQKIEVYEA